MSNTKKLRHATPSNADRQAARQDQHWFATHPQVQAYTRDATAGELKQYGLAPGTKTRVFRISDTLQARAFVEPKAMVN